MADDLLDRMTARQWLEQFILFQRALDRPACSRTGVHLVTSPFIEGKCEFCGEVVRGEEKARDEEEDRG